MCLRSRITSARCSAAVMVGAFASNSNMSLATRRCTVAQKPVGPRRSLANQNDRNRHAVQWWSWAVAAPKMLNQAPILQ